MMATDNSSLRIAYTPSGGAQWTGGVTYQKNLLIALQEYAPRVKIYILSEQAETLLVQGANYSFVRHPSNTNLFSVLLNKFTLRLFENDYLLTQTLRSIPNGSVDLVFPGRYGAGRGVAILYWIPDFQHVHLPEMYSQAQILDLNKKFKQGIKRSTLVVLSSKNAQDDFQKFTPEFSHKARVMNFVAHIPQHLYESDPRTVVNQYHLPEKFIYLPNQFWKHKNHIIVFEALRILKKNRKIAPFVVFTGNPIDVRNPLHFASLMQKISEWGLRDQVAFLGLIPQDHVYKMIRQSVCVLNPSLFEGWSTTVEEAKSVGKRVLLSDLRVHREQNPPTSVYFDPNNSQQLADVLAECWVNIPPGPDVELEYDARQAFPGRMKQFAETFASIASEAVKLVQK